MGRLLETHYVSVIFIQIFLASLLLLEPLASAAENSAQWSASLYGRSAEDSLSNSKVVGTSFGIDFQKDFSKSLYGHFRGSASLETGS